MRAETVLGTRGRRGWYSQRGWVHWSPSGCVIGLGGECRRLPLEFSSLTVPTQTSRIEKVVAASTRRPVWDTSTYSTY
ncbi:hypothetical protein Pcinc_038643 [Petrolisthes cinctipes]|uniref:Uncharacterized protein n=1 Tax=Petrolisthes cinctipes TaxID=88211 RepID=A0AAE1EJU4_PETCI|nr:hypothetical protein Pcinc_038643 [Petrolisthes cinctipes]